jgi:hypothetical protein
MAVLALEFVAGGKLRLALVILPHFSEAGLAWLGSQSALFKNIAFLVTLKFEETRGLAPI